MTDTPFHAGELAVQERLGVRERIGVAGPRLIRPVLLDQHRDFYRQLPFLALGSVDDRGRPWASVVTGRPGFLSTPDERTLTIAAQPVVGDPLADNLRAGADIGVLGMQLETRRRNRMTGRIAGLGPDGFSLSVLQSFGNCPKYIQTRSVEHTGALAPETTIAMGFGDAASIIAQADTFFIATAFRDQSDAVNQGADVSHRGGKPGFVKVEDDNTILFPDFAGNNMFNTIGNLAVNPRAGLLFADFETQTVITTTGEAEVIWDGPEVDAFDGARRLIRYRASEVRTITGGLPLRTTFGDYAPDLQRTGDWPT